MKNETECGALSPPNEAGLRIKCRRTDEEHLFEKRGRHRSRKFVSGSFSWADGVVDVKQHRPQRPANGKRRSPTRQTHGTGAWGF